MLELDGYSVWDCIHDTRNSSVYTGVRDADGLRVVLKVYSSSREAKSERAKHEFEALKRIDSPRLVRPVALVDARSGPVLVVERVQGFALSDYSRAQRPSLEEFFWIALGISDAIADVHDARMIHKDIKLSNIMVDPDRMKIALIDFGLATEIGRAEQALPPATAEGTMHYIAPEQTGRMGLAVDFRTDLYSLGATLYELLTGEPPFRAKRGLDLVCAHMAQTPTPPHELTPSVPLALSRIVAKLLQKDPEQRYQTARGLSADLGGCAKQLQTHGEIDDDFALGTADASDRLRFPSRIYGRQAEIDLLSQALERTCQGTSECILLAAPAGMGKSSLPGVLREPLVRAGGYLAEAKFDLELRDRPYAGIAALIESLACQVLAGRAERVAEWSLRLRSGVGAVGAPLTDLAPSLAYVVDDFPAVPRVGPKEARERLCLAFSRFVGAFATRATPLVLFLDDLQWADAGSLSLISSLVRGTLPEALLLIGGYRDDEVSARHPALRSIETLHDGGLPTSTLSLRPLGHEDTVALLSDALCRSPEETDGLARRVGPKSQYNPLMLRRLMFHLWDLDLIRHEHGRGWVWDEQQLTEAEITDDAAAVVAARVDRLAPAQGHLIKAASLLGTVFELETLVEISGVDRLDVLQAMLAMVDQGLIAPCRDGFKFVHDRIREAAQSRLSADERGELHHRAVRALFVRTEQGDPSVSVFAFAEHLLGAAATLSPDERSRAVEILAHTAHLSLERASPDAAIRYLRVARELLTEPDWSARFQLAFQVQLDSIEAATQLRDFDLAESLLAQVEPLQLEPIQRALVIAKRITLSSVRRDGRALDLALEGFRRFGVRWPKNPGWIRAKIALLRVGWVIRDPTAERTFAGSLPDGSLFLPISIVSRAAGPELGRHSQRLVSLAVCYLLCGLKRYGIVLSPSFVLATHAAQSAVLDGNLSRGRRFALAAEYWMAQNRSPSVDARARVIIQYFWCWVRPRPLLLAELERAAHGLRELGDSEYAYLALHDRASAAALCGLPLTHVEQKLADLADYRHRHSTAVLKGVYDWIRMKNVESPPQHVTISGSGHSLEPEELCALIHMLAVQCLAGYFDMESATSERLQSELVDRSVFGLSLPDFIFYRGYVNAVLAGQTPAGPVRRRGIRVARGALGQLRFRARSNSEFTHMAALLAGELQRARRHTQAAFASYAEAASRARKAGYLHHEALAHERTASLMVESGRYMKSFGAWDHAIRLYEEWGATLKVRELEAIKRGLGSGPGSRLGASGTTANHAKRD